MIGNIYLAGTHEEMKRIRMREGTMLEHQLIIQLSSRIGLYLAALQTTILAALMPSLGLWGPFLAALHPLKIREKDVKTEVCTM
jgi:hypothetical protein